MVKAEHGAVPIEKVKVGDKVWARNQKTGATELRRVTAIAPQHRDKLVELRIAGEKEPLRATPVHPFRVRRSATDTAHWIDAGDLVSGEQIETQNGRWAAVQSVTPVKGLATVYNLTVEEDHDYFVGDQGLLVHNAGPDLSGFDATGRPLSSPNYSVWNQTTMPNGQYLENRYYDNQYANEQLYNATQGNPDLANALGQDVTDYLQPNGSGTFAGGSPPGMSWHHSPSEPGSMELIPRAQHRAPGPVQDSLHPDGRGGYANFHEPCD